MLPSPPHFEALQNNQGKPDHADCRSTMPPGSTRSLQWTSIPFLLFLRLLPTPMQRKTLLQPVREAARHAPVNVFQERKIPYSERRRRNTGFLFLGSWHWAAKSTCLSSTSFPPRLSHILLSFSVWVPSPFSPIPLPSPSVSWSCQGPLQMTLTGNEKKKTKARTWNQATGGEVDIVCLWVLIMKVPLVGDLYGCAFKLCILHITGNKY